jgi:hypothetical protein
MIDVVTVSQVAAYFNRLPDERQSEILGIAEAFTFTQQGAESDPLAAMRGILREPLTGELAGKKPGQSCGDKIAAPEKLFERKI